LVRSTAGDHHLDVAVRRFAYLDAIDGDARISDRMRDAIVVVPDDVRADTPTSRVDSDASRTLALDASSANTPGGSVRLDRRRARARRR
jgi:hypothetical protein